MKKNLKKWFSSLLAAALVVGGFNIPMTAHAAEDTVAYLAYADNNWAVQYWDDGGDWSPTVATTAEVTGYGTYTVGLDFSAVEGGASGIAFLDVEIRNGEAAFPNSYMTIDSVKINGEEVALTGTPYTSSDDDVATRSNLYNAWVGDATTVKNARTADGSADGITPVPVDGTAFESITSIEVTFTLGEGVLCNASEGGEATLSTESYPAFIAIGGDKAESNDWGISYAGEETAAEGITVVNGELKNGETTTLSLEFESPVVYTWYVAPAVVVPDSSLIDESSTFDIKVYLDDVEVTPDLAAGDLFWAESTGNYATEQCIRLAGGYNEWGTKYMAESPAGFSKITFEITPTIYISEPEEGAASSFDPSGVYHAALGIQTCDTLWITRMGYFCESLNDKYGTDEYDKLIGSDPSAGSAVFAGDFTDIEIAGNGTYTVKLENADFGGETTVSQLFVATDIPLNDQISVTDLTVTVNDKEIVTFANGTLEDDAKYTEGGMIFLAINHWRKTLVSDLQALGVYEEDGTSGIKLLTGEGGESVTLTFTVSGFDYDNEAAVAEPEVTAEPEATAAPEATEAPAASADSSSDAANTTVDAPVEDASGNNTAIIVIVVIVVVAAVAIGAVVMSKKKKEN